MKIFNLTNIIGILRSGGDTKFGMYLDAGGMWFVGVPLAYIAGMILGYPVFIVYFFASLEEAFKLFAGIKRLVSRNWLRNLVEEM